VDLSRIGRGRFSVAKLLTTLSTRDLVFRNSNSLFGGKVEAMRSSHAILVFAALCVPGVAYGGQAPVGGTSLQNSPTRSDPQVPTVAAKAGSISSLLQGALDNAWQTVGSLQMEKWKRGPLREEASANIISIRHDVESTLPDLLKEADASPGAVSKVLPVSLNINALYDVLLRVVEGAQVAAPGDQFAALQSALTSLEKARHALNDQMQLEAGAQEKQIGDLKVALKTQPVPVCPVAPPPPPPAPAVKKATPKRRKPAPKPATNPTTPAPASNSQPAKPNQ